MLVTKLQLRSIIKKILKENMSDDWDVEKEEDDIIYPDEEKEEELNPEDIVLSTPVEEMESNYDYAYRDEINLLRKLGLTPVEVSGKTLIGIGSYGRVYNVIYKGENVVAKIGADDDIPVWKKLLSLDIPEEYKKYLPKVKVFFEDLPKDRKVIVVEKLVPLKSFRFPSLGNRSLSSVWENGRLKNKLELGKNISADQILEEAITIATSPEEWFDEEAFNEFFYILSYYNLINTESNLTNNEKLEVIKSELFEVLRKPIKPETKKLTKILIDKLIKEYSFYILESYFHHILYDVIDEVLNYLKSSNLINSENLNQYSYEVKYKINGLIRANLGNKIYNDVSRYTYKSFPTYYGEVNSQEYEKRLPVEFRGIYRFLLWLKSKGVKWSDLHSENVMINPKTKEIVISDVGMFEL